MPCLNYTAETRLHLPVDCLSVANILRLHPGYQQHIAPICQGEGFVFFSCLLDSVVQLGHELFPPLVSFSKTGHIPEKRKSAFSDSHPSSSEHLPFVQAVLLVCLQSTESRLKDMDHLGIDHSCCTFSLSVNLPRLSVAVLFTVTIPCTRVGCIIANLEFFSQELSVAMHCLWLPCDDVCSCSITQSHNTGVEKL